MDGREVLERKETLMRNKRALTNTVVAVASAILATLFLVACEQNQTPAPAPPPDVKPGSSEAFVIFEGPWAIVPDPKDPKSILAIAPKSKSHRPLAVVPANKILEAGVYDLAIPTQGGPGTPTFDKGLFRTDVKPENVQRALDTRLERYAIRLPKPDAYLAETRYRSRVGASYPPDASTEQDYATSVALRYTVSSKTGFSLAGTQDVGGAFNPLLLELGAPFVRFDIEPMGDPNLDLCGDHSRASFHELTRLLGLTLFVDFKRHGDWGDCHKKDPQLGHSEKAQLLHGLPWTGEGLLSGESIGPIQMAGMGGGYLTAYLEDAITRAQNNWAVALYFFHTGACLSPIIVGNNSGG